ncbi:MAG: hypothetical protein A4E57_02216 [Syntrophorhabdaceae bacterium PtaU1.Bin034]|jgi:hypothetical protein|nr:MAG: hypothetical protein A4E57_02216 [Syntrophorhabdaceae bacterium PtaU1.Bin034]
MCVAVVGGMDRLERSYKAEAERQGVELRVFTKSKAGLGTRLKAVDAVVIFTGKMSHRMKNEAVNAAKSKNIPVIMAHSCGVCTLRECLDRLVGQPGEECARCPVAAKVPATGLRA